MNYNKFKLIMRNCSDCGLFRKCLEISAFGRPLGDYPCRDCFEQNEKYFRARLNAWYDQVIIGC